MSFDLNGRLLFPVASSSIYSDDHPHKINEVFENKIHFKSYLLHSRAGMKGKQIIRDQSKVKAEILESKWSPKPAGGFLPENFGLKWNPQHAVCFF